MNPRILVLITCLQCGGAENMLLKWLSCTKFNKEDVMVVNLSSGGIIQQQIEALGVKVVELKLSKNIIHWYRILLFFRLLRTFKPTVVFAWMPHPAFLAALGRLFSRAKVVWNFRCEIAGAIGVKKSTEIIYQLLAWPFFQKRVTHILYNSQRAQAQHIARGYSPEKSQTIPNGFLLEKFIPSTDHRSCFRKKYGIADDVVVIGMVARNHAVKNYAGLIKAVHRFYALSQVKTQFVFIGAGVVESQDLQSALAHYQLQEKVLCLPQQQEIYTVYPAFDFFVLPSVQEGFSNVLGEAMLCGIPCITTDVGDSAFIVGEHGWVLNVFDVEVMAKTLAAVVEMPPKNYAQYAMCARQRIIELFDIKKISQQYDALLMQCIV